MQLGSCVSRRQPAASVVAGVGLSILLVVSLWPLLWPDANAAVLPEDRADLQLHIYDGGGVEVSGPALLVRKDFFNNTSVSFDYYRDSISGASPDVMTNASPYSESRDQLGAGVDYLFGNSIMSLGYSYSTESDYTANAVTLGVSHEMFGAMTTVNLGFTRGFDQVRRSDSTAFGVDGVTEADIDRFQYRLGLSQVLTRTSLLSLNYETILDDGFLNSPYRFARVQGSFVPERYPGTRTSHAVAAKALKYWQHRASSYLSYRYFTDTWDIGAHTFELGYSRYFGTQWLADFYFRHYTQSSASFYSDNFQQNLNFVARDKELSSFSANTLGARIKYDLFQSAGFVSHGTFSVGLEYLGFDYDDYTDLSSNLNNTSPYSFDALTLQLFFSFLY